METFLIKLLKNIKTISLFFNVSYSNVCVVGTFEHNC